MSEVVVLDQQHSLLGPSSSDRWLNCPGSVLLTKGMSNGSRYAAEGNAAHEVSEWCRFEAFSAKEYLGRQIKVDQWTFKVNREMVDAIDTFVEYVDALPGDPLYEARVSYESWVPGGFGTLDDARLSDGNCYITDLKYGKGVQVYAQNNTQLLMYALGCYNDYNWLYDFKLFCVTIHQPRLDHVDYWHFTLSYLLEWAEMLPSKAERCMDSNAEFQAGHHCFKGFCAARSTCAHHARWKHQQEVAEFDNLDEDFLED